MYKAYVLARRHLSHPQNALLVCCQGLGTDRPGLWALAVALGLAFRWILNLRSLWTRCSQRVHSRRARRLQLRSAPRKRRDLADGRVHWAVVAVHGPWGTSPGRALAMRWPRAVRWPRVFRRASEVRSPRPNSSRLFFFGTPLLILFCQPHARAASVVGSGILAVVTT